MPTPEPGARLSDTWTIVRREPLFLRVAEPAPDAPAILHLHGFAMSGAYLTTTCRASAAACRPPTR